MKKYIVAGCLAACFCSSLRTHAQSKEIIFGSTTHNIHSKSGKHGKHGSDDGKNSITTGMISWLNGYQPVYYERALTSFLSIRVGAGSTFRSYGNDFGQIAFDDGKVKDDVTLLEVNGQRTSILYDIKDDYASYTYRKCKIGTYLSIAPRIYFNDNVLHGFTLFPMLELKTFKYDAQLADTKLNVTNSTTAENYNTRSDNYAVPHSTATMAENMKCVDFTINIGGNFQSPSHLDFAWHFGFGVRNFTAERLDIQLQSNIGSEQFVNMETSYKRTRPFLTADFCIGGWW